MLKKNILGLILIIFILSLSQALFAQPTANITLSVTIADNTPPLSPAGLSAIAGDAIVDLSWEANTETDIAGYNVYRSQIQGGSYTQISTQLITATNYQDTGLVNNSTYYYVITAVDNNSNESGYSNEVSAVPQIPVTTESESNNDFNSANSLVLGTIMQATIDPAGDYDYFKFTVSTPGMINVSLTNVPANIDAVLTVFNYNFTQLAYQSGDLGQDLVISCEVALAGEYYVRIYDKVLNSSSTSPYNLQVTLVPGLDAYEPNNNFNEASVIALDEINQATIFAKGDNDYYKVTINTPGVYKFLVTNVSANIDAFVYVYKPNQGYLASGNGNLGQDVEVLFEASSVGDYYVRVYDSSNDASSITPYNLQVGESEILITNVSDAPDAFSPNGDGSFDAATISYFIAKNGLVTIKIYNDQAVLVRTLIADEAVTFGTNTVVWDGKDDNGVILEDGTYTYTLDAQDYEGNNALQQQSTSTIANHFMTIIDPIKGSTLSGIVTLKAIPSSSIKSVSSVRYECRLISALNWSYIGGYAEEQSDGSWTQVWDTTTTVNGVYEVRLLASYFDLNNLSRSEYTNPIEYTVSNTIIINNVSDAPDAFSPNGDNRYDVSTISYLITKDAAVTIKIYDSEGILVQTVKDNLSEAAGTLTAVWDGKDDNGVIVADGVYTYTIDAYDDWQDSPQQQGTVTVDNHFMTIVEPIEGSTLSGAVNLKAVPSANITNVRSVRYEYRLTGALNWNKIGGYAEEQPDGSWLHVWDTTAVSNNNYELRVTGNFKDLNNNSRDEYSIPIEYTISNGIDIINVSDAPDAFSPNADNRYDTNTISYLISEDATVAIKVYDSEGILVRTLKDNISEIGGAQSVVWDGADDSGVIVADGTYTYTIDATNGEGINAQQQQGTITVDNHFMTIVEPIEGSTLSGTVNLKAMPSANITNVRSVRYEYRLTGTLNWNEIGGYAEEQPDGSWLHVWDTTAVSNNDYELRVTGNFRDLNNTSRTEYSLPIEYSTNNITVMSCSVSPELFSPNADMQKDTTVINAVLSGTFDWTITIKNSQDAVVKTYSGNGSSVVQTWDGKDVSDITVTDGVYTCFIDVYDPETVLSADQKTCAVEVDTTLPIADITAPLSGEVISGDLEIMGTADDVNFKSYTLDYGLGENPLSWVNIQSSNIALNNGSFGLIDSTTIDNGVFTLKLSVEDDAGNRSESLVSTTIDNILITNISVIPQSFDPGAGQTCAINFTLDRPANITIKIYQAEHEYNYIAPFIKTFALNLVDNAACPSGENSFVWDGKDNNGVLLPFSAYVYSIEAVDGTGKIGKYDPSYVQGSASVENMSVTPEFDPYKNQSCVLSYDVLNPTWLKVTIFDAGGSTERILVDWEPRDILTYSDLWNGRNDNNNIVNTGTHIMRIDVKNLPENYIITRNTVLEVSLLDAEAYLILPYYNQISRINYTISKDAKVSIKIYDPNESYFCTLQNDTSLRAAGNYSVEWDGKNDNGDYISIEGDYRVELTIVDAQGAASMRNANIVVYR